MALFNNKFNNAVVEHSVNESAFIADSVHKYPGIIVSSHFPAEPSWRWNQTKSRTTVPYHDVLVSVSRITPRRRTKERISLLPSYKLWLFHVRPTVSSKPPVTFTWCEKGCSALAQHTPAPPIPDSALPSTLPPSPLASNVHPPPPPTTTERRLLPHTTHFMQGANSAPIRMSDWGPNVPTRLLMLA